MKYQSRHVDGVLLLDKAYNISSNKALQEVKHLFRAKKAGHTGTLDPLATGLLPLCLGEATKFSSYILKADKTYEVTYKLGERTTTADIEGEVVATKDYDNSLSKEALQEVADSMVGVMMQVPPMYSALKVKGIPLYELARQGKEVLRQPRKVKLFEFTIDSVEYPFVSATVKTSTGFYVRTLGEDFADKISTLAHVTKLHRTTVGPFDLKDALSYAQAVAMEEPMRDGYLIASEDIIKQYPFIDLNEMQLVQIYQGKTLTQIKGIASKGFIRLYYEGDFVGLGLIKEGTTIWPKRLLNTQRISYFNN